MLNIKTQKTLLLILAVTLAIKLVIVLWLIPQGIDYLPYSIGGFTDRYDNIARNLVAGNGYRLYPDTSETLLRTPGYVLVLTAIFYVFGDSLTAAQVVNILFGIATAYIIAHIAAKWAMLPAMGSIRENTVEWAPLAPAILFLYHPGIIFSETRGGSESLFILLLTTFVYFLYSCVHTNRIREFILAGIILGLAMLVRSTPALIPVVFFPYLLSKARFGGKTWRSLTMNFAIMGLTAFTDLAPVSYTNLTLPTITE